MRKAKDGNGSLFLAKEGLGLSKKVRVALRAEQPAPRLARSLIDEVRQAMLGRGFALVNVPPFLDAGLLRRLKRGSRLLSADGKGWRKFPQLARYGSWLERLLGEALPEEPVCLASLEFRHEPAGTEDKEVDRLHADGFYIRAVYTLYGPATIYRDSGAEVPVPPRQILLLTAMDRARAVRVPCTLHRRPGVGPERAVVVCSFKSQLEVGPTVEIKIE